MWSLKDLRYVVEWRRKNVWAGLQVYALNTMTVMICYRDGRDRVSKNNDLVTQVGREITVWQSEGWKLGTEIKKVIAGKKYRAVSLSLLRLRNRLGLSNPWIVRAK